MILRPYQEEAVKFATKCINQQKNALIVAPTGSGKTIMMGAIVAKYPEKKILIVQHRDELLAQNADKIGKMSKREITIFNATTKDQSGEVVLTMAPTLCRHLSKIAEYDIVIFDEAHHLAASTWKNILKTTKNVNNNRVIIGFTATPERGDKQSLLKTEFFVKQNCFQIRLNDLIRHGYLVPPEMYRAVMDKEFYKKMNEIKKKYADIETNTKAADELTELYEVAGHEVVRQITSNIKNRRAIIFCCSVDHSRQLAALLNQEGYKTESISYETPNRTEILARFRAGETQILTNVFVLTEGFDDPEVSMVVLTRPNSYKSTTIQMIGRGLRIYNGKKDCLVLDFGDSIDRNLDPLLKTGYDKKESLRKIELEDTVIDEDVIRQPKLYVQRTKLKEIIHSVFPWFYYEPDDIYIIYGFQGAAFVKHLGENDYLTLGLTVIKPEVGNPIKNIHQICRQSKAVAFVQADDYLRNIEENEAAQKGKLWQTRALTTSQFDYLKKLTIGQNVSEIIKNLNRSEASAMITYLSVRYKVQKLLSELSL